jgi:DNA-binding winged helix-turn-helix (wHTH) protein
MKMFITGSKSLQDVSELRKSIKRMGYNPSVVYTYDRKGIDECVKRMKKSFKYDHIVRKYDTKDKKVFRDNLKDILTRVDNVVIY